MDSQKRPALKDKTPLVRQCQYGAGCYRKNPQHFVEYAHKHLSDIRLAGRSTPDDTYTVPDALFMSREIVLEQLQILDRLGVDGNQTKSNDGDVTPAKRPKTDVDVASASGSKTSTANSLNSATVKKVTPIKLTEIDQVAVVVIDESDDEIMTEPTKKPVAITATQLQKGLSQATKVNPSVSASTSANSIAPSQADQLAAYRARHIQQKPQQPQTSASASTQAHINSPSIDPCRPTTSAENPHSRPPPKNIDDYISVVNPRGQMAAKLTAAAPYNFFLTTITASLPTHTEPLSITFQEILDTSLGTIESSVQMNFMIDIGWLLGHYYFAGCLDKPLLVLYGDQTPELLTIGVKKPQVTAIKVQMSSPFGTHHTKMMLLGYTDGSMRVVISTANLVEDDWYNRTQGLWLSPRCPRVPDDADTGTGAGPTGFRDDLVRYLVTYNVARLQPWIGRVRRSDFSAVNVFFVASVPGGHRETPRGHDWGHAKLGRLLGQHCAPVDDACPVVTQSSSIGTLGPSVQAWVQTDIVNSMRRDTAPIGLRRIPGFRLVYPSYANVRASHDDLMGGGGLPYRRAVDAKQPWLKNHLCQWKSGRRYRSQAMPHIKTYCRWSARGIYWFCLTSANLSKAAWGAFNKGAKLDAPLRIMSYEVGVLFVPKFVLGDATARFFPLPEPAKNATTSASTAAVPPFPMPYDVELQPYGVDDKPFLMDYLLESMQQR